ncbi:hypothetical protein HX021_20745 [Sphingobacterium sp. N143]|uniref:hypothetical protein n=1 Tax=Sphingobacterium sp. N143 TaxID=2746727 RepID=UPI002577845B|nr:hypothetical protein [Sphingobacterium sp. N143]MDM1296719.1 hypothetical protein [Sphingobacterium sp. N143]
MIFELVQIILIWSLLNTILQYTTGAMAWPLLGLGLVAAGFCYWTYPLAVEQSVPLLKKLPEDPVWLQRITVLILAELIWRWLLVHSALRAALGYPVKCWRGILQYIPLPGLPAALFLFQVLVFYADSSIDFETLAMQYAVGISVSLIAIGMVIRWLLPNRTHRLELAQIMLLITAVSTCLLSVNIQFGQLGAMADKVADYRPFAVLVMLILLMGAFGYIVSIIRKKRNGYFK